MTLDDFGPEEKQAIDNYHCGVHHRNQTRGSRKYGRGEIERNPELANAAYSSVMHFRNGDHMHPETHAYLAAHHQRVVDDGGRRTWTDEVVRSGLAPRIHQKLVDYHIQHAGEHAPPELPEDHDAYEEFTNTVNLKMVRLESKIREKRSFAEESLEDGDPDHWGRIGHAIAASASEVGKAADSEVGHRVAHKLYQVASDHFHRAVEKAQAGKDPHAENTYQVMADTVQGKANEHKYLADDVALRKPTHGKKK